MEDDPKTFKKTMALRDSAFWKEAIQDEMDSIMNNQTWEHVDLPKKGLNPLGVSGCLGRSIIAMVL